MKSLITIRHACSDAEREHFWRELNAYHIRDMFPDPEDEDREYFLSNAYRVQMEQIHDRKNDRAYYLFFDANGTEIGFAMPVIYNTEDGKCFLMEFCVYPEYRGSGTGKQCAAAFLKWAEDNGAVYCEINCDMPHRQRFWENFGFLLNGRDEWGVPLMLLPPKEKVPITIEKLTDPEDWQLLKLMNGFLSEIGEECLTEEKQDTLKSAVREERITFFVAKHGCRAVGMCSVTKAFSTFCCADEGIFDDFYIEPVFRGQGIARMLTTAVQKWCREQGIGSLTVTCAPCDEEMYQNLGFSVPLGRAFACLLS